LKKAPKELLLDIDHLRSFEVEPAYFGLGFIQLKIKHNGRVHFYHDDLPVLAEEPHNHRYGFISYIMQGYFDQTIYQFTENAAGTYYMDFEDCNPELGDVAPPQELIGSVTELFQAEYQAGDYYRIEADTLHTVSARENAITYLVRDEPFKDFAGVVRSIGEDKVCPFSKPIPAKECWEMIEDMLPVQTSKKKKKLGYHVRDIPKGKVGEPDKIVEEAYEILDAHEQGIRIMAELEMSDLYGALDRYREMYYPELKMKDIERMYRVTRRAFDNGKRK